MSKLVLPKKVRIPKYSNEHIAAIEHLKLICQNSAADTESETFNYNLKPDFLEILNDIFYENVNTMGKLQNALMREGIKLISLNSISKINVFSNIVFFSGDQIVIGIDLKSKSIGDAAMKLFHSIGHIFLHLISDKSLVLFEYNISVSGHRRSLINMEADQFACKHLIPARLYSLLAKNGSPNLPYICKLSKEFHIHQDVIVKGMKANLKMDIKNSNGLRKLMY